MSDNRNYLYQESSVTKRVEFSVIEKIVGKNKKVIDLGCGDGSLMQLLSKNGNKCHGVEISQSGVDVCKKKGLNVVEGRIDTKLPYKDKSFDVAICNVTLHMAMYPEVLIKEMRRISKKQIVTFPNFGFIVNRFELMFSGVFPRWSLFGYSWYSTGHIHQLSIKDYANYCAENKISIVETHHLLPGPARKLFLENSIIFRVLQKFSNLSSVMGVFVTK
jgi:methionine biosynthesis protein MetW